jgi:hypothetical protein
MESEPDSSRTIQSKKLWLPFLLIAISVIMALGLFLYWVYDFASWSSSERPLAQIPKEVEFLVTISDSLALPLFVLAVAWFLMMLTSAKKGNGAQSRLIFLGGALILLIGGFIQIGYGWLLIYDTNNFLGHINRVQQLWDLAQMVTIIGWAICFISVPLLIRCYLKGEISGVPKEPANK